MKIAVDLTSLSYHMTGIERYASCVVLKMLEQDYDNEYILIFRNTIYEPFNKFIDSKRVKGVILKGNNKLLFMQLTLMMKLYEIKADKYLFLAFTSPVFFIKKGIYNTIHDMGAWDCGESMSYLQKMYWKVTYKMASFISEYIITVSEFSRNRICEILKFPKNKIIVAYPGINENIKKYKDVDFRYIKEKYKIPNRYILTLSTLEPRKNIEMLLRIFVSIQHEIDYDLVLVGRKGWKMDDVIKKYNIKKRVHITGFVADEDLAAIYKNATCFVFPSVYEGFGIPPIEALAMGTPVVASKTASLPEILMAQAVYFKNNSESELKDILLSMNKLVVNMPKKLNKSQKEEYDFKKTAKRILELLYSREG